MFWKNKLIYVYGASLAVILLLLQWLQYRFVILDHSFEIYIGSIALLFMGLGVWLTIKLSKPKLQTVILEKNIYVEKKNVDFKPDAENIKQLGISKREMEVLALIAEGLTNQEIADKLFVSLNTIKTHSSSLFEKLEVNRRLQAIEKAKQLGLII